MKIGMVSPYVPKHFGGGEKYFFDVARILIKHGHTVEVGITDQEVDSKKIQSQYENFLGTSLTDIQFVTTPIGTSASFLSKLLWTKKYDLLYYLTNGSLFFSLSKKNILHIQFPFQFSKASIMERLRLKNWSIRNSNSEFTRQVIEKNWHVPIQFVHHPMISDDCFQQVVKKEKVIVHVGRFFRQLHSKRQDVLVEIFAELLKKFPKEMSGWKFVLIGSVEDQSYAKEVAQKAKNLPIRIIHDASRMQLLEWYKKASIYWHATGYEVDEAQHPEKTEHFGISTAEAMASGCVPIVLGKGGQKEVVGEQLRSLLWFSKEECQQKTIEVIKDNQQRQKIALQSQNQAQNFGQEKFEKTLLEMIK